jgi:hypothetical protein
MGIFGVLLTFLGGFLLDRAAHALRTKNGRYRARYRRKKLRIFGRGVMFAGSLQHDVSDRWCKMRQPRVTAGVWGFWLTWFSGRV